MTRIACCVPFCRRTCKSDGETTEWICPAHWRLVPKATKAAYQTTRRRTEKILRRRPEYREWWKFPAGSPKRLAAVSVIYRHRSAWDRCKAQAIEQAGM